MTAPKYTPEQLRQMAAHTLSAWDGLDTRAHVLVAQLAHIFRCAPAAILGQLRNLAYIQPGDKEDEKSA